MSLPELDPALRWVVCLSGALLWLSSSLHKLRDPNGFRSALWDYRLLPPPLVDATALALTALEGGLAVSLLVPASAPVAALASAGLLGLYAGAMAWNLLRGRRDLDCGCGGAGGPRSLAPALVARNAVAAALFLLASAPAGERALTALDAFTVPAAVLALALVWCAVDLVLSNGSRLRAWDPGGKGGERWTTR